MRKPNPAHNSFKEKYPVFLQAKENSEQVSFSALAAEDPAESNKNLVNPPGPVTEFVGKEQTVSEEAMRDPISGTIKGTRDDFKKAGLEILSLPQTALNMVTAPIGAFAEKAGRIVGTTGPALSNLSARLLMAVPALAFNIGARAVDAAKLGVSAVNVVLSKGIRTPLLKASKLFRTGRDTAVNTAKNMSTKTTNLGSSAKTKVTGMQIPVVGKWDTQSAANDDIEGQNDMPLTKAA